MESLAGNLTKAISELLEQDERRHVGHKSDQDKLTKQLESLDIKCDGIGSENDKLREELKLSKTRNEELFKEMLDTKQELEKLREESKLSKTRNEELSKEMVDTKQELEKLTAKWKEFNGWINLISVIATQINSLNEWRDGMEEKAKYLEEGQVEIAKELRRRQLKSNTYRHNNLFLPSPDEELNELSEQAESLRQGVEVLNNLHRSFNSYSYSDDASNT